MRDWLPTMFDHIEPWFSDVDIDAGSRGLNVIQERLDASAFGIIVVTPENLNKPWLVFEAGALSKRLKGDPTKVVAVLAGRGDPKADCALGKAVAGLGQTVNHAVRLSALS